ncbi:MAG: LamG domain-containing protein [Bacteroidales bacterium]|nr:LamG domain-containing protein [Bacteroidales bacterium]
MEDTPVVLQYGFTELVGAKVHNVKIEETDLGNVGYFNGRDAYVSFLDTELYNVRGNMCISVWLMPEYAKRDNYSRIVAKREGWDVPSGYELEINTMLGRLNISGAVKQASDQGIIKHDFDTTWHHYLACLCDTGAVFYIDGALAGYDSKAARAASSPVALTLGAAPDKSSFFMGHMRNLTIINRAVSAEEARSLYEGKW